MPRTTAPSAKRRTADSPRDRIAAAYWRHRLTHGRPPASVFAFCDSLGIPEAGFYAEFPGFAAIESAWWRSVAETALAAMDQDPESGSYDAPQKLLAFLYGVLSALQPHRSRLVECLPPPGPGVPAALRGLHAAAHPFFEAVVAQGLREKSIADRGRLTGLYPRALWEQFRWLLEYHRRDSSEGFQDTDALVEKGVRLFFDAAGTGVVESALDLVRFLARHLPTRA